jgi:hypothetical protein
MARTPRSDEWSDEDKATLIREWDGESTAGEIGAKLRPKRSKDAVISKARKLELTGKKARPETKKAKSHKAPERPKPIPQPPMTAEERAWKREMWWEPGDPRLWKGP